MNIKHKSKLATVFFGGFLCGVTYLISCGKVNTNEASATGTTTRYVKANGTSVGEFVSLVNGLYYGGTSEADKVIVTMSSKGYLIPIRRDGAIDQELIYFTGAGCSGTAYARKAVPKSVLRNGTDVWYVSPTTTETLSLSYQSSRDRLTGACNTSSSSVDSAIEAILNDSAVTGVSVNGYSAPITIE